MNIYTKVIPADARDVRTGDHVRTTRVSRVAFPWGEEPDKPEHPRPTETPLFARRYLFGGTGNNVRTA